MGCSVIGSTLGAICAVAIAYQWGQVFYGGAFADAWPFWCIFTVPVFVPIGLGVGVVVDTVSTALNKKASDGPKDNRMPSWPGQPHRTQKEAERGRAEAQFTLGLMYANGQCVPEDKAEATKWYGKAAEQGNVDAQKALGAMYATGDGVPKNYSEAYAWYSVAAKNGDKDAKAFLSKAKAALTPDQLAVAQRRAAELNEQINANKAK